MKYAAAIISFLFHPIWFPIYGAILYLFVAPIYLPIEEVKMTWLVLVTISVVVPTLAYIILYMFNWLNSPFQVPSEKRKWLFYGYIGILLVIALNVTTIEKFPILYFYMMNLSIGCFIVTFMLIFRLIGSLSVMLMGGITGFSIFSGIFYHIDLMYLTAILIFASGLVASSRIYLTQQTLLVVFLSWLAGFLPQIALLYLIQ